MRLPELSVQFVVGKWSSLSSYAVSVITTRLPGQKNYCWTSRRPLSPRSKEPHLLSSEALPGLSCLPREASQARVELSKPLPVAKLDIRQMNSLVVSESWQKKRTEETALNCSM